MTGDDNKLHNEQEKDSASEGSVQNGEAASPSAMHEDDCHWKKEAENNLSGWKRAMADYQNLKKEGEQRQKEWSGMAYRILFMQLLPILDNLNRVFVHMPASYNAESWYVGLSQVQKQWDDLLRSHRIQKVATIGELFDPKEHEAVGEESDVSKRDHEITQEAQPGYYYEESLLYPAKVIINKIPST